MLRNAPTVQFRLRSSAGCQLKTRKASLIQFWLLFSSQVSPAAGFQVLIFTTAFTLALPMSKRRSTQLPCGALVPSVEP